MGGGFICIRARMSRNVVEELKFLLFAVAKNNLIDIFIKYFFVALYNYFFVFARIFLISCFFSNDNFSMINSTFKQEKVDKNFSLYFRLYSMLFY